MSWQDEASQLGLDNELVSRLGQLRAIERGVVSLGTFGLEQGKHTFIPKTTNEITHTRQ